MSPDIDTSLACHGDCLTAADVGVSLPGNPIAYAHPECRLHNPPAHTEHVAVSVGAFDDRLRFFGSVDEAVALVDALRSDARVSAAMAQRHAPSTHVAVTVERLEPDDCGEPAARYVLRAASVGEQMYVTTDEAAALVTALLADGAVHAKWLHGGGR